MATSPRHVVSLAVAFALAVPALAAAQRTASGSSSSTSSGEQATPRSTGSSSSGGSSGGGSSSERTVGSSSSGSSQVTMPQIPTIRSSYESSSSGQRTAPPGSTSTGSSATPRGSSGSSGSSSSGSSSSGSSGSGSSSASPRGNDGSSFGRSRDGRPSFGVATPRETIDINGLSFPVYGPSFARWYPFGTTGFGYNFGYVNYDPWFYSRTPWIWGWNGLWYDPYDPFGYNSWYGYNPYGYGYGYPGYSNSYGGGSYKTSDENDHVGSIRLRANPSDAQVYVDGALMGVVDDFDGFSSHLKLAGGTHRIELKADGYEPYSGNVTVSVGKTITERISLKKKK